jgi:hypothetical protein
MEKVYPYLKAMLLLVLLFVFVYLFFTMYVPFLIKQLKKMKKKLIWIMNLCIKDIQWLCNMLLDYVVVAVYTTRVLISITLNVLIYIVFTILLWLLKALKVLKKFFN